MAKKRVQNKNYSATEGDQVTVENDNEDISEAIAAMFDADAEIGLDSPEPDAPTQPEPEAQSTAEVSDEDYALFDEAVEQIEAEAAPVVVSDEDFADDVAADIAATEAREGAYADQESEIDYTAEGAVGKGAKKSAKGKTAKEPSKRVPKQSFEDAIKALHAAEPLCLDAEEGPLDETGVSELIGSVTQKKVQEKVVNMLQGIMSDGKMSVYTVIALDVLKKAYHEDAVITGADIRKAYEEKGYKSGTVSAQQGQMMSLFPALGLVTRPDRSTLKPNKNSVLLDILCS